MDLGIAIPTSQVASDWTSVRNFVADTLNKLDIGTSSNETRVAIVTYRGEFE